MNEIGTVQKIRECCFAFFRGMRVAIIIALVSVLIVTGFSLFGVANGFTSVIYIIGLFALFIGVVNGFIKFYEVLNIHD